MSISVQIPSLGESVTQAVLLKWHKKPGDRVEKDEALCELETDKANVDVPSPGEGVISTVVNEGQTVSIGQEIARIDEAGAAATAPPAAPAQPAPAPEAQPSAPPTAPAPAPQKETIASPAAQRVAAETGVDPATVSGTGREGRVTKEDVAAAASARGGAVATAPAGVPAAPPQKPVSPMPPESPKASAIPVSGPSAAPVAPTIGGERREPMSKIRRKIAERLVAAQRNAAILTTFNEVDLSAVQDLRGRYKERFNEVHGVGLGLMSFFVRAAALALKEFPRVNSFIDGNDIVYHDYVHMGIAVSTDRGLAVPVLRNAHAMSFGHIEAEIRRVATAAREGKLALDELSGGTFTITNGGVFGSLLSTPILNPPQSGILGMHTIQKRPVAIGDKVEVRPMMYVALSYDHRVVDGRESVSFLVRLKQYVEDPTRLILEV
jgi:2-oxoglutarate dehydrogenase E2 component (dihydrolipoamide succinyltransferase)